MMTLLIRALQFICYAIVALISIFLPLLVFSGGLINYGWLEASLEPAEQAPRILYAVNAAFAVLIAIIFYHLGRLMSQFAAKRYFSFKAVHHMRWFAAVYIFSHIAASILGRYLDALGGDTSRIFAISQIEVSNLLLSLLVLITAHVLNEARKNQDELEKYF